MKILIIRFSAIGDIVWTTPVVRMLKNQIPNLTLHYATKPQYKSMLEANPYIDKLHFLGKKLGDLIQELKNENFDLVIDLHKNLRSLRIRWALGKKVYTYQKQNWKRWLLIWTKINLMKEHICDRYQKAVLPLGVKPDGKGLDYFIKSTDEINLKQYFPHTHQTNFAAFVIGASTFTKKLPHHKLVELSQKIQLPIILVGGKEDKQEGEKLAQTNPSKIINTCGKFNISQSASILKQAKLTIGHDTGLTHIAAAFSGKVYIIFGSTHPSGYTPYCQNYEVLENQELSCRPCSRSGREKCPKGHFKCMNDLVFKEIE
jgi:heptosyltransferase-2